MFAFAQIISYPISDSAKKTEIVLLKNSGIVVAVAMNVDAATSYWKTKYDEQNNLVDASV